MKITEGNAKLSKVLLSSFISSPKIIKSNEVIENNKYSITYGHLQKLPNLFPQGWEKACITFENIEVHVCGTMSKKKHSALKAKWDKLLNDL